MTGLTTRATLLSRLRSPANDDAWREFDARYGALILRFCHSRGLQYSDADDVRQVVMLNLAKGLPAFKYNPQRGRFRTYLGRVIHNAILRFRANRLDVERHLTGTGESLTADDNAGECDERWEREWVTHHYRLALYALGQSCDPRSLRVFHQLLDGATPEEAAEANQLTVHAVYKVRQRVRDRLREQIALQMQIENRREQ